MTVDSSIDLFERSLNNILLNKLSTAKEELLSALEVQETDKDSKSILKLALACVKLVEAFTAGALDQASAPLPLLEEAETESSESSEYFINTLIKTSAQLFVAFCLFLQQRWTVGAFTILKAWRGVDSEFELWLKHDRKFVRSFALFLVGTMSLTISVLPSSYVAIAEFVGFTGSRNTAVEHLRLCASEKGPWAPFAMVTLTGFFAAVKPFMFEQISSKEAREVGKYLAFGAENFHDSYFFSLVACTFYSAVRKPSKAIAAVGHLAKSGPTIPALQMLMLYRKALAQICGLELLQAKVSLEGALLVQTNNERKSYAPYLAFLYFLAGGAAEANEGLDAIELIDTYREDKDTDNVWLPCDKWAFRQSVLFKDQQKNKVDCFVELLFGVFIFACVIDQFPASVVENLVKQLQLDPQAPWDLHCKRNIIFAEVFRSHNRLSEALALLDELLDDDQTATVGAIDAIVPLAYILQGIVFVQAGEVDAAKESVSDLDSALVSSTSNLFAKLSRHSVTTGTEFDTFVYFKRHALERRIESGGFESIESSEPD
jgi:hypothetical protein